MLKITTQKDEKTVRLVVEGKLTSDCISVLENCWHDANQTGNGKIEIELIDITYVDESGKSLLQRLARNGAKLFARNIHVKAILENLEEDNNEEEL